jgi:ABC-2 type transport system ATP-binding protein
MIARALMHAPKVLFLDEPTTGLDPAARLFVWDRLRELEERGVTLVLTTHDMDEAAALSTRVGIMDHGKLLALDTPGALIRSLPGRSTLELSTQAADGARDRVLAGLAALPAVERVEQVQDQTSGFPVGAGASANGAPSELRVRLYLSGEAPQLVAPAASLLAGEGLTLSDVKLGTPTLEDVFIAMTGRTLR